MTSGVFAGCSVEPNDGSTAAAVTAQSGFKIVYHADPSKCVDVDGSSAANNARIVVTDCGSAGKSQVWTAKAVSGSYGTGYQIINANSGLCLDTVNASTTEHAELDQYRCGARSKADQAWKLTQQGTSFSLQSAKSGLCVDLTSNDTTNGTPLQQYTCAATDTAQLFDLVPQSSSLPDLVITSLSMTPALPALGQAVTFSAVVKNQGASATPAGITVGVAFEIDGVEVTWSGSATSLAAGASETLVANGGPEGSSTWTATAGTHVLKGIVNDVNRFPESDTSNNSQSETLSVGSGHSVTLSWNASTTAGVSYNLYRGTAPGGPYAEAQSGISSTSATDTTVSSNTTYYYVIRSQNAGGESGDSNQVVAVIPQ